MLADANVSALADGVSVSRARLMLESESHPFFSLS